jgi:hypothetical protein
VSDWVERYFTAWNGTDPDAFVAFLTDDVEMEDVTAGHLSHGRAAARRFFEVGLIASNHDYWNGLSLAV